MTIKGVDVRMQSPPLKRLTHGRLSRGSTTVAGRSSVGDGKKMELKVRCIIRNPDGARPKNPKVGLDQGDRARRGLLLLTVSYGRPCRAVEVCSRLRTQFWDTDEATHCGRHHRPTGQNISTDFVDAFDGRECTAVHAQPHSPTKEFAERGL